MTSRELPLLLTAAMISAFKLIKRVPEEASNIDYLSMSTAFSDIIMCHTKGVIKQTNIAL